MAVLALAWTVTLSATSHAEEFHLEDGSVVVAAYIGEANGEIHILDSSGERTLARSAVTRIRWTPVENDDLRRRAASKREKFHDRRVREIRKLVGKLAKASTSQRESLEAEITRYAELERIPVFAKSVVSRHEHVREFTLTQLAAMDRIEAVAPLVLGAIGIRDAEFTDRAHLAALKVQPELTRLLYEYAGGIPMQAEARLQAFDRLGRMGDRDAGESLIVTYHALGLEAEIQHAKKIGARQRPLSLGNTQLTVELPVVSYFKTSTNLRYKPAEIERLRNGAIAALEKISGEPLGHDLAAWTDWWKEYRAKRDERPPGKKPSRPG
ncbi:MAG: hypothetical protein AAF488_05830 [Planctomycetota bacterium]